MQLWGYALKGIGEILTWRVTSFRASLINLFEILPSIAENELVDNRKIDTHKCETRPSRLSLI